MRQQEMTGRLVALTGAPLWPFTRGCKGLPYKGLVFQSLLTHLTLPYVEQDTKSAISRSPSPLIETRVEDSRVSSEADQRLAVEAVVEP